MHRQSRSSMFCLSTAVTIAAALLNVHIALAQRSSPQFSLPPPGSLASQFGNTDVVFAPAAQDSIHGLPPQSPALVPLGAPSSSQLSSLQGVDSQLLQPQESSRQPLPQLQANLLPQQPQQGQLSRPSISITSLAQQQQQQQQQQSQQQQNPQQQVSQPQQPHSSSQRGPQSQAAAASSVSSSSAPASVAANPQHHQSTRHHSSSTAGAATGSSQRASQSHQQLHRDSQHSHSQNVHPASVASAQAASSDKQAAIEAARKAEATAASLAAASSGHSYHCPDSFGFFRHHKSCDKYYACENGTATLKLCGNGLMFDDSDPKRENCAYPFSVDCGSDRTDLEPPISTPHCPRLYGLFADTANCRVFYSCWNGEASKYECPPGLAYDNDQRVCVWADLVDRCDQSEVSDGFVCPDPTEADQPGHYTRHAHPTDCRKFYVCIEGVARPYGCSFGTVFNVDSLQCDEPDNVSGCEKYYGDMDPKLAKKLAREGTQQGGTNNHNNNNNKPAPNASN